jgi:hypothetical protein
MVAMVAMVAPDQKPGVEPAHDLAGRARAAHPGDEFFHEAFRAALGVGGTLTHPGVEHFTSVGTCREDRVIPEPLRVAVTGALFVFADDLGDGRVDIDDEALRAGTRAHRPRATDRLADHRVELTDMAERERTQECPQRRRSHHPSGTATPAASHRRATCPRDRCATRPPESSRPATTPRGPDVHHQPGR